MDYPTLAKLQCQVLYFRGDQSQTATLRETCSLGHQGLTLYICCY